MNRHGHGLQYAAIESARKAFDGGSYWGFQVSEFPVAVRGLSSRADFVLHHASRDWILTGECKRVNPAIGVWVFLRAPYLSRERDDGALIVERIRRDDAGEISFKAAKCGYRGFAERTYHIGLPVRIPGERGDAQGAQDRNAIEKALKQAFLGVNGLVEYWRSHPEDFPCGQERILMPIIVTTARLFCWDVDLAKVDLKTGQVESEGISPTEIEWVYFEDRVSPSLRHGAARVAECVDLARALDLEYARTVAIVNSLHLGKFLRNFKVPRLSEIEE